jgi:SAM-dependent methyltransferase
MKAGYLNNRAPGKCGSLMTPALRQSIISAMNTESDNLFDCADAPVRPFRFDAEVVRVFPDMVRRSVPGYLEMVELIGLVARRLALPDGVCYDLGCSLGAVTDAILRQTPPPVRVIAVDNAPEMIAGLIARLQIPEIPSNPLFSQEGERDAHFDQSPPAPLFLRGEKEESPQLPLLKGENKSPQPPLLKGEKEKPLFEKGSIKPPFEKGTLEKPPFEKGGLGGFEIGRLGGFQGADTNRVTPICADVETVPISAAAVVVLNLTLQFIAPERRLALLARIHAGLRPGGALILVEKIAPAPDRNGALLTELHADFKRAQGYSELAISRKRAALEQVLVPDSIATHEQRLTAAGFSDVMRWYQSLNFVAWLAWI